MIHNGTIKKIGNTLDIKCIDRSKLICTGEIENFMEFVEYINDNRINTIELNNDFYSVCFYDYYDFEGLLIKNPKHYIRIWVESYARIKGLSFECDTYICTSAAITGDVKCNTFKVMPVHMKTFSEDYYKLIFERLNIDCDTINIPKSAISKAFLRKVETIKSKDEFYEIFGDKPKFNHLILSKKQIF